MLLRMSQILPGMSQILPGMSRILPGMSQILPGMSQIRPWHCPIAASQGYKGPQTPVPAKAPHPQGWSSMSSPVQLGDPKGRVQDPTDGIAHPSPSQTGMKEHKALGTGSLHAPTHREMEEKRRRTNGNGRERWM
ncbi:hypothetical protein WISP_00443 [Willisornis vidua]|uniref:Uncharacterized protein n=1 Tax=Willisornis vidua TaxID=1566151 RepID=A0ABQ9DVI2_9PASS|nr:hypothetical protein WISP_00443 [Willisornis vidua]